MKFLPPFSSHVFQCGTLFLTSLLLTRSSHLAKAEFVEIGQFALEDPERIQFGYGCNINNDTVMVGAVRDDDEGEDSGSIFAYDYDEDTEMWSESQRIFPDDAQEDHRFGFTACQQGNVAVITGVRCGDKENEEGVRQGCFYVFSRTEPGASWVQQRKVFPDDGSGRDAFGSSCAWEGDTLVIGSSLARVLHVYVNPSGNGLDWEKQAVLKPPETDSNYNNFGHRVKISGDTIVEGRRLTVGDLVKGSQVYVFVRSGTEWSLQARLKPSGKSKHNYNFGMDVAIDGDMIAVSSSGRTSLNFFLTRGQGFAVGAVTIFKRSGTTWTEVQRITPFTLLPFLGGNFGKALDMKGGTLIIGEPQHSSGFFRNWHQGMMHVYKQRDGSFQKDQEIFTSDGRGSLFFGLFGQALNQDSFPQYVRMDRDGTRFCASTIAGSRGGVGLSGAAYAFEEQND